MGNALSANHPESNAVGVDPTPARRDNRRACLRALTASLTKPSAAILVRRTTADSTNKYGKVGQQRQEGFVSGAESHRACRGGRLFTGLLVGRGIARRFERYD